MTRRLAIIGIILISTFAFAATAEAQSLGPSLTWSWVAPTTNVDGLPLSSPIGSYRLYAVPAGSPPPVPGTTVPLITLSAGAAPPPTTWSSPNGGGLATGSWVAYVDAVNANGESVPTLANGFPFVYTAPAPPKPASPTGLTVKSP